jgi:hypothetical protein
MKINKSALTILSVLVFALHGSSCLADWKPYAFSVPYINVYQGEKEIELYTDYQSKDDTYNLKNQLELEYGITANWMAAVYGVFKGSDTTDYRFVQTKIETKYRFGGAGEFILDPAIYFEYKMNVGGIPEVEFKEILSKDFGDYNITTNLVAETSLAEGAEWEYGYTLGFSKLFTDVLRGGVEVKGSMEGLDSSLYVAPSVSLIWGVIKVNLAVGFGMNPASKTINVRNIISYEF